MIPLKLELKNFLSYGEPLQTIDFQHHALLCLSGKNGHGKSALLDAITWAIWGQARKTSGTAKADEGLLKLGQTRMLVSLEFALGTRIYRARREFAKTYGKPHAALDFEVFDTVNQRFVSLTDKTIRATQEKIELLVGIDFETFINSAFLRQGQSNEFSKKSPKERKQILSSILGLEKYDHMHQKALDLVRKYTEDKKLLLKIQENNALELSQEQNIHALLTQEKENILRITLSLKNIQEKLTVLEHQKLTLTTEKTVYTQLTEQKHILEQNLHTKTVHMLAILHTWKKVHTSSLKMPSIKALEEKKWVLIKQEQSFLEIQQKQLAMQEKILHLKEQAQKHRVSLQKLADENLFIRRMSCEKETITIKHIQETVRQKELLKADISQKIITLEQELIILHEKALIKDEFDKKFATNKAQFEKRRAFYQALIQKGNWTKNELTELEQKKKVVHDHSNPACPLCDQVLTVKRKQFLSNQFAQHETFITQRLVRIGTIIKKLKEILVIQHHDSELLQKEADLFASITHKQEEIKKQMQVFEKSFQVLDTEVRTLTQEQQIAHVTLKTNKELVEKQEQENSIILDKDPLLVSLAEQLKIIETEKAGLIFDHQEHKNIKSQLHDTEILLQQLDIIRPELDQQLSRKKQLERILYELRSFKKQIVELINHIAQKYHDPEHENRLITIITEYQKELALVTHQKDLATQNIGSYENDLQRIKKITLDQQQNSVKLLILEREIEDYQTISQSLSKNGIQALLIEEAIPEIEAEANTILAKLTDNQAQIFMESLRDLKSGGVKETLDIQISDSIGIRPYEMFSGGEAFRVDFALRIAISKLLAHRAGTALQTLIIDEGFGSQDEDGLARIMEAIYAIQKDFSKIIIVSHLLEFKDNFPVHFIIEKTSSGSTVSIEERG